MNNVEMQNRRVRRQECRGAIVALTGSDGTGKSTLADELARHFGIKHSVVRISPGKPQGRAIEAFRTAIHQLGRRERTGRSDSDSAESGRLPHRGIMASFASVILAAMRARLTRKALRLAESGHLVVADRWPTLQAGKMDGPRLSPSASAPWHLRLLARIERWFYSMIPPADLCVWLYVAQEDAVRRNRAREKSGKEDDRDIRRRYRNNRGMKPIAKRLVTLDNSGTIASSVAALRKLIFSEISRCHRISVTTNSGADEACLTEGARSLGNPPS